MEIWRPGGATQQSLQLLYMLKAVVLEINNSDENPREIHYSTSSHKLGGVYFMTIPRTNCLLTVSPSAARLVVKRGFMTVSTAAIAW